MSKPVSSSARLGLRIDQAKWQLALPDGARRLIASGDFDGRDNETLVLWLSSEPELSERLLRWCNTPLYNLSRPYPSLEEAAKVMDGCDLARLAVLAWVRRMFLPDAQIDIYSREGLWSHSIAVGAVAMLIARTCNAGDPGLVFIAGALHDIGLCASERLDPDSFREVVSQTDELSPTHEVEKDLLGWDHSQLGAAILDQWGMPEAIQYSARYHHIPEQVIDSEHAATVGCVAVANYLCSRSGWASTGSNAIIAPAESVFRRLGIDAGLLTVLWTQLSLALDSVSDLR
ncbi:HDOD domain protein [Rubripirellula tenax]|uniref:HDOD domain protein n=1 Tax=Rubripirellula tenax TaxID=2528015 RepID=A0A5C6FLP4_9BACT|nr:HDOD domain-containing protein [Rubripirellula tenax]TWU60734.1 HDOD domain protein [Rubripirellula tenax]